MLNLDLDFSSLQYSDRYVVLGNHHDAWTFGAADPNSGTAILMELGRALSDLRTHSELTRMPLILKYQSAFRMAAWTDCDTVQLGCRGIWTNWLL